MRPVALALTAGLLAVPSAPPAAAAAYSVESSCRWVLKSVPNTFDVVVVVVAEAHALGDVPAVTTTVTCTATNVHHESVTATATSLGPSVYATSSRIMRWDGPEVCADSEALWLVTQPVGATVRQAEDVECKPGNGS